jgi:hypothetical protein
VGVTKMACGTDVTSAMPSPRPAVMETTGNEFARGWPA